MDEYCAVCAEPIQFAGYGPCGHKEACSKCVVRLRVVLNDLRCVICQQEHDNVFITKYMGDFTQTLPAAAFSELPVGVAWCWKPLHMLRCDVHAIRAEYRAGSDGRNSICYEMPMHTLMTRSTFRISGKLLASIGKSCPGAADCLMLYLGVCVQAIVWLHPSRSG